MNAGSDRPHGEPPLAKWSALRAPLGVVCGLLLALGAAGPQEAAAPEAPAHQEPAPPRILLLGDTTFGGHFRNAARALKGAAEVVPSPLGHLHSGAMLERLEEVLGEEPWDVVVLNVGLSDLMTRDPRSRAIRAMSAAAGGVPVTPLAQYGPRLERLVTRLRATGARVVWLTTLPLNGTNRRHAVREADLQRYRARALERMGAKGVPVVDTHQAIVDVLEAEPNLRARPRLHNDTLKSDLSGPLVKRLTDLLAR